MSTLFGQRRIVTLLMLALLAPAVAYRPVTAQDDAQDRANASAAAQQIFQLAADRNFNAMYDLIHPDAHAVVPREAAIGAFQDIYTKYQASQSQIVGVKIVQWTWGVTGKTYDHAAEVDFVQPYTDQNGQQAFLQDSMYLVQDDQGTWRWFFGSSKQFVAQAIEQYSGTPVAVSLTQGDLMQNVVNDLDAFWRDVVSYTPYDYQSPHVVVVSQGQSAQTACGPAEGGFAAFYCPPDQTLYLDEPFLQQIQQQAPFAAAFVIAHEWAHHIQSGIGFVRVSAGEQPQAWNDTYSIELELMADCFAGDWAQDAYTRGVLDAGAIDQAVQLAVQMLGDPQYVGPYDPQAHGTGEQRATSIMNGYKKGFLGCNVKL